MSDERFLDVKDVRFDYEGFPMHFDLSVRRGECMALLGPSGAGKSTLLGLIAGFEQPLAGRILIDGRDVVPLPPHLRPLTMVFQEHNLFPHLDVATNVALGVDPRLRLTRGRWREVEAALARTGLAGLGARRPAELSGGQRQRVALARVLVRHQPVVLLDEPFAALGPALRHEMLMLVDGLRREQGLTVLLVSHQPDDARFVAERTAFLHGGRIMHVAATRTLLDQDPPEAVREYLGT